MKVLQERWEVDTLQGRTLFGILLFQDLVIIPMLLITPIFMGSGGPDLDALSLEVVKVAGILLVVSVLARWVIPGLLYRVARQKSRELFIITIAGDLHRCCMAHEPGRAVVYAGDVRCRPDHR
jgi:CPA2 family monovalent cation:H+ antiporter-2